MLTTKVGTVYLAGGCFWGIEAYFQRIDGVLETTVGYANGYTADPTYEDLLYRNSGHAETVKLIYDTHYLRYVEILEHLLRIIDPTAVNRQGADVGVQYRSGIFYLTEAEHIQAQKLLQYIQGQYQTPLAVELKPLKHFYAAEPYHQKYLAQHPQGYCHVDLKKAQQPLVNFIDYARCLSEQIPACLQLLKNEIKTRSCSVAVEQQVYERDPDQLGIYVDADSGIPLFLSRDLFSIDHDQVSFTQPISMDLLKTLEISVAEMAASETTVYYLNRQRLQFIPARELEQNGLSRFRAWL